MKKILFPILGLLLLSVPVSADGNDNATRPSVPERTSVEQYPRHYRMQVLSNHALERIIKLAKEVSFSNDRRCLLEAALIERHITCDQCIRLMKELADFDDERLDIVRLVRGNLADPENIIDILDEFSFSSNRDTARELLRPRR